MFRRRPPLPDDLHTAWWAFVDCAEVIEGGRRQLLATLPAGRVEPAPIGIGLDALVAAVEDARRWMAGWRVPELEDHWQDCNASLGEALDASPEVRELAASPGELEELLGAVSDVVEPLDAFADAERAWRQHWRLPTGDDRERDRA
jgi:hypothetical protein